MSATQAIQILTISTALFTSGGIAALSAFDIPLLRSQPASRSLPMLRWLFSRGSHTAPTGILLSSTGFAYLAYAALPASASTSTLSSTLTHILKGKPGLFLAASALSLSTALFTSAIMLPTNLALVQLNEDMRGSKSAASAAYRKEIGARPRSAEESINGKEEVSQWTDVSDAQSKTGRESTAREDDEVRRLLSKFGKMNYVRAGLMGAGGVVGLVGALA